MHITRDLYIVRLRQTRKHLAWRVAAGVVAAISHVTCKIEVLPRPFRKLPPSQRGQVPGFGLTSFPSKTDRQSQADPWRSSPDLAYPSCFPALWFSLPAQRDENPRQHGPTRASSGLPVRASSTTDSTLLRPQDGTPGVCHYPEAPSAPG